MIIFLCLCAMPGEGLPDISFNFQICFLRACLPECLLVQYSSEQGVRPCIIFLRGDLIPRAILSAQKNVFTLQTMILPVFHELKG